MRPSIRALALPFIPIFLAAGTSAAANTVAPGVYKGQTTQGDQVIINVGNDEITSWSSAFTCSGSQFPISGTEPANSCPILSSGNFQCGDIIPACGTASLQGAVVGPNMLLGTIAAYTASCACFQDVIYSANLASAPGSNCRASAAKLCLSGSRFEVAATWTSPTASGTAQAVALTDGTGYLWFFSADEVEVVVKMVDGCALNQHHWVFAAGLTNVHVVLTVTDTTTGTAKSYANKQGTLFQA